jgi:hypothetical protein
MKKYRLIPVRKAVENYGGKVELSDFEKENQIADNLIRALKLERFLPRPSRKELSVGETKELIIALYRYKLTAEGDIQRDESEKNVFRKSKLGEPYYLHSLQVCDKLKYHPEHTQKLALLHDVIEDIPAGEALMKKLGIDAAIIQHVHILSKPPSKANSPEEKDAKYHSFIDSVIKASRNEDDPRRHALIVVKYADITNNTCDRRNLPHGLPPRHQLNAMSHDDWLSYCEENNKSRQATAKKLLGGFVSKYPEPLKQLENEMLSWQKIEATRDEDGQLTAPAQASINQMFAGGKPRANTFTAMVKEDALNKSAVQAR